MHLIERVEFHSPLEERDRLGGRKPRWNSEFPTRAAFQYLRGGEKVLAGRIAGTQTLIATIRKSDLSDGVENSWMMLDRATGKEYAIRGIEPNRDKPRQYLDILCETVT
ncbi:phage head closure protein [Epibacterium ulvae]|uniref:phage head closure protein n=1 Tax=Epibacterium ulvae TaxID=1156985 RepID=UPI002491CC4D|nr:phage head closure protein [Epibacterium ulvae]